MELLPGFTRTALRSIIAHTLTLHTYPPGVARAEVVNLRRLHRSSQVCIATRADTLRRRHSRCHFDDKHLGVVRRLELVIWLDLLFLAIIEAIRQAGVHVS